jgi:hypothetical protein
VRHLVGLSRPHPQPAPTIKHRAFSGPDATRDDKQRHEKSRKQLNYSFEEGGNYSLKESDKIGKPDSAQT